MAEVIRFVNPASSGGDGTTSALSGANAAYASMALWEAGEQTNLAVDGDTHRVKCAGGRDATPVSIIGWGTNATNFITVEGDHDQTNGFNTGNAFSTLFYYLDNAGASGLTMGHAQPYTVVDGIQLQTSVTVTASAIMNMSNQAGLVTRSCRLRDNTAAVVGLGSIVVNGAAAEAVIETCTIEMQAAAGDVGINGASFTSLSIFNVTIEGGNTGINIATLHVATITNCCIFNCVNDINDIDGNSTISFCATDDGDGTNAQDMSPGGVEADDWNAAVTDYVNGDYRPLNASSILVNNGTATGAPSTDILGHDWDGNHEIGAFSASSAVVGDNLGSTMSIRMGIGV